MDLPPPFRNEPIPGSPASAALRDIPLPAALQQPRHEPAAGGSRPDRRRPAPDDFPAALHSPTIPGEPDRAVARALMASAADVEAAVAAAGLAQPAWGCPGRRRPGGPAPARSLRGCESAASSWPPWRCASAPSPGRRPMPTCARRSTSSSTTRGRAVALGAPRPLVQVPGEHNELRYVPRGVTAVISPWNFPLAICCG